ncbi:hypothetical protein KAR02_14925, partial [Candidatus Bipolaricaulota bacterium]|nr:hypothetical protein [Candidatus Bipolaricaulota bacterium]
MLFMVNPAFPPEMVSFLSVSNGNAYGIGNGNPIELSRHTSSRLLGQTPMYCPTRQYAFSTLFLSRPSCLYHARMFACQRVT